MTLIEDNIILPYGRMLYRLYVLGNYKIFVIICRVWVGLGWIMGWVVVRKFIARCLELVF